MNVTAVFIQGEWLSGDAWNNFRRRYSACGYTCIAPPWPLRDDTPRQLRQAPPGELSELGIAAIVEHYDRLIRRLQRPPLLIGHSLGGLIVQLLLDRGLGCAGIALAAVPPARFLPRPGLLYRTLPLRLWGGWGRVLHLPRDDFARSTGHFLSHAEAGTLYDQQAVPTPARVFFDAALGIGTRVDFANDRRAPLLLVSAGDDRIVPPRLVAATYRRHQRSIAITGIKRFANHSHWLINEPGWEVIADYTIDWAHRHLGRY
ncbi:alpha/beta fold hydrolase [Pseudomonas sp. GD03944]|uniref:alpha/beta hydrolase n=1 Tax=Pseudomonas sp. GD03944 TaxID=2975409 RepID=UPI002447EB6D|nr:alpha/beta fold hydrolase [Pseudomonas sp. GD03944]MDH1264952.1 alpha/beta fold hydrolase [Pseudomonas sp. GD03944]